MSFRRRPKPMLAASAVAKARSRPTEKLDKPSIDNNLKDNICQTQASTSKSSDEAVGKNSNYEDISSSEVPSSNPEQDTKHLIAKSKDTSNTCVESTLLRNRFTKVKVRPALLSRSVEMSKKDDINENDSNVCEDKSEVTKDTSDNSFERIGKDCNIKKLISSEQNVTPNEQDIKETLESQISTKNSPLDLQSKTASEASTEHLKTQNHNPVESSMCLDDTPLEGVTESKTKHEQCHSGFIITNQEISDLVTSTKEDSMILNDIVAAEKIHITNNLDDKSELNKLDTCKEPLEIPTPKSAHADEGITEKEITSDQPVNSLPTIKGRFKRRSFMPNIGKQTLKADSKSVVKEKEISESCDPIINNTVANNASGETPESKVVSGKRFRRAKVMPNIVNKKAGKDTSSKTKEEIANETDNHQNDCSSCSVDDVVAEPSGILKKDTAIEMAKSGEITSSDKTLDARESLSADLYNKSSLNEENLKENLKVKEVNMPAELMNSSKQNTVEISTGDAEVKNVSGTDVSLPGIGKDITKKPRRARFKPNIKVKEKTISKKEETTVSETGNKNTQPKEDAGSGINNDKDNKEQSNSLENNQQNNVSGRNSKKHVRFTPNISLGKNRKDLSKIESLPNCDEKDHESSNGIKENRTKEKIIDKEISPVSTGSKSHSDAEDGSQSESEGLHHHNKRKFAPCLGPKVRQRRRMSSMTLSEDEGGISEKMTSESGKDPKEKSSFELLASKVTDKKSEKSKKDSKDESEEKKKAKKRSRIVIKEPKEKMTMFDFIYYNPQSSEKEKDGNDEEPKEKKRRQDEVNIQPESETILETLGSEEIEPEVESTAADDADNLKEEGDDDNEILAPQIRIGEDGNIIIDEESLVLKTTRSKISLEGSKILYDDGNSFNPYRRRKDATNYKKRWPVQETLKFYRALSRVGTDFSLMVQFFPDCTRRNLKHKFKTEEKFNCDLIDRALKHMLPMDEALFDELEQNKKGGKKELEAMDAAQNEAESISNVTQIEK